MNGTGRAFLRLLSVQGSWNYERMQGIGMGYAAEPLLRDLRVAEPGRYPEAVVRSAEFFNANPYLAGLALGGRSTTPVPVSRSSGSARRSPGRSGRWGTVSSGPASFPHSRG